VNNFRVVTITHKTANINHIGRYIPSVNANPTQLAAVLHQIKLLLHIDELMYMATCNRLTFLMVCEQPVNDQFLIQLFSLLHPNIPQHCIGGMLDVVAVYNGTNSVQHIFEVAASLDSLVVGEREIIRQLRQAYEFSRKHKLTGDNIRLLIETAIPLAKEVYTNTKIGENSVSVVSLAMQEMLSLSPSKNSRFVIVGAGQTNTLVAKFLLKHDFKHFVVFNRTRSNAEHLGAKLNAAGYTLDELASYKKGFDILITCTGAAAPIITPKIYTHLLQGDKQPKIVVDLAVPTDVANDVLQQNNINYIAVEKLRSRAAENLALRKQEIVNAQVIIEERLGTFKTLLRKRRVERVMASEIPSRVKAVKERALTSVFQKEIAKMDEASQRTLERVVAYLEKKYIGIPITVAKSALEKELMH